MENRVHVFIFGGNMNSDINPEDKIKIIVRIFKRVPGDAVGTRFV